MDKQTRNLIQKATQDARNLLEIEFGEQLEGVFDILPNGQIAPEPGKHLNPGQRIIREKVVAAIEHEKAGGVSDSAAVDNYLREVSFTCLMSFQPKSGRCLTAGIWRLFCGLGERPLMGCLIF